MNVPTRGETYTQIIEHARKLEELCATMAHLHNAEDTRRDVDLSRGWMLMSDMMKRLAHKFTDLAKGRLN